MELFSEIYGLYYHIVTNILNKAPISRGEAQRMVTDSGFAESVLQLIPKLLDERTWPLLDEQCGNFVSRLHHPARSPVSLLELQWLKAVLYDPRARLFLADQEIVRLEELLFNVTPLFDPADFVYFDRYRNGDDYYDFNYIRNFRNVLAALREQTPLRITYHTGKHKKAARLYTGSFLPLKLEYSEKDDKFRAYCAFIRGGKPTRHATINLGRILETADSAERYFADYSLDGWFADTRSPEPIIVDIYPERNAVERFLLEFSAYEKQSEFNETTGVCRVRLWYPLPDETELLIRILGFGPTVRVLAPKRFVQQIAKRISNQLRLLEQEQSPDKQP